jgi:NAD(P)-dependent dehydrogenase (short-subunit alcohol dehydrogenase family)
MAAMAVICITGSSDGIGLATARVLVADGHRVLIHARSRDRGRLVLEQLGGETTLVTGELAQLDEVHRLADQIHANGPVDALVHNAGVWVRGNTPRTTANGLETTFAVNVLAPHLLTHLLAADVQGRLLWLGSSSANFGRPDPTTLGGPQEPRQAYSDSKACDVALALAWSRRLPRIASAAVDPGWVKTKLASAGAPGDVTSSADTLAYCCTEADLASAPYWKDRADLSSATSEGRGAARRDRFGLRPVGEDRLTIRSGPHSGPRASSSPNPRSTRGTR